MKKSFISQRFLGIGFGIYGDIIGRQYEAAFIFLLQQREKEAYRETYPNLVDALRASFPFEQVQSAWRNILGHDELWNSYLRFWNLNTEHLFSDDTVLTCATMSVLEKEPYSIKTFDFSSAYHKWGNKYPKAGYGSKFKAWLKDPNPTAPYQAQTNGSAMRVGPIGYIDDDIETVMDLALFSAAATHNSNGGILGAQVVAETIHTIRCNRYSIQEAAEEMLMKHFQGKQRSPQTMPRDKFEYQCLSTVSHCLQILTQENDFEEILRSIMRLGGDTDTIAMICGSIFGAQWEEQNLPTYVHTKLVSVLPFEMLRLLFV